MWVEHGVLGVVALQSDGSDSVQLPVEQTRDAPVIGDEQLQFERVGGPEVGDPDDLDLLGITGERARCS